MQEERIKLPLYLALAAAKELKDKHGIEHFEGGFNSLFTHNELSKIKRLTIEGASPRDCLYLSLFTSLEDLSIVGSNKDLSYEYEPLSINDDDLLAIEKCSKLKRLQIIGQSKISFLDVSRLRQLEELDVRNCPNLEQINGIRELENLSFLTCYGNASLFQIGGLDKAIEKGKMSKLELDVLLFPSAIGYNSKDYSFNQQAVEELSAIAPTWTQAFSGDIDEKMSINQASMIAMHDRACQILHECVKPYSSEMDRVLAVESYLARNVVYDKDSLETKHTSYKESTIGTMVLKSRMGPEYGANSTYNCIMNGKCVCEGYTRGEQYLLALCGIKSREITCLGTQDTIGMSDSKKEFGRTEFGRDKRKFSAFHSILCVEGENFTLYSDPCWNAAFFQAQNKENRTDISPKYLPFSLKTKEEISKTHTLSFMERNIANNHLVMRRNVVEESLEANHLFRKTTKEEVKKSGRILNSFFLTGMISKKER